MRYFYDTEFLENGHTIDLISIGIVAEDGSEYYAVNKTALWDRIAQDPWLMDNVVPHLPPRTDPDWKTHVEIANDVSQFLMPDEDGIELWADYAAYDHVALAQLFGRMINLPPQIPMFTHEFQQAWNAMGRPALPEQTDGLHDALADARHLKACFEHLGGPPASI